MATAAGRILRGQGVIVVSSPLKQFLVGIGVPAEQIIVMPNGANPEIFHPGISGLSVRRTHGLEGQVIVGFSGILRPWHGLDLLLDAGELNELVREFVRIHRRQRILMLQLRCQDLQEIVQVRRQLRQR